MSRRIELTEDEAAVLIRIAEKLKAAGVAVTRSESELLSTGEVAKLLRCSVFTVRRRASTPGDPLFAARSRVGCKKPYQFRRAKLIEIERTAESEDEPVRRRD